MNPEAKRFLDLSPEAKRRVHLDLCARPLSVWDEYVRLTPRRWYAERVSGTRQEVDDVLPHEALEAVASQELRPRIGERYREPIQALQDGDWELPESVACAYYAIFNTYRKYIDGLNLDVWVIVNQALGAHPSQECASILSASIAGATGHD